MSQSVRQIFQQDAAWDVRESAFKQRTIMSHIATDIHEKRFLGVWVPALRLLFKL